MRTTSLCHDNAKLDPPSRATPGFGEVTICTCATKAVLGFLSHPCQLIRARLMDKRSREGDVRYVSVRQATTTIFRREGLAGFYRGVLVGFTHTVPRTIAQFQFYELALASL